MFRKAVYLFAVTGSALAIGLLQANPGGAASVGSDQRFVGEVNANHTNAVIAVACPGPIRTGQTGAPVGGQTVAVVRLPSSAASAGGTTDATSTSILVSFGSAESGVTLKSYGVAKLLPAGLELPCSGKGIVTFTPTPSGPTGVSDQVTVTFQNVAV